MTPGIRHALAGLLGAALLFAAGFGVCWWLHRPKPEGPSPPTPPGWTAPSGEKPDVPDAPAGSTPVAVVTGSGGFRRPAPPIPPHLAGEPAAPAVIGHGAPAGAPLPGSGSGAAQPPGCGGVFDTVTPEDLAVKCRTEIVTLEGHPFARLFGDAGVQLPGGRQVWRGEAQLGDVKLDWTPPPVPASRPRTLIGLTVGGWADSGGAGPLVGGIVAPSGWAIATRGAEGRIALVWAVHLGPGGELEGGEVAATLLFGAGRR